MPNLTLPQIKSLHDFHSRTIQNIVSDNVEIKTTVAQNIVTVDYLNEPIFNVCFDIERSGETIVRFEISDTYKIFDLPTDIVYNTQDDSVDAQGVEDLIKNAMISALLILGITEEFNAPPVTETINPPPPASSNDEEDNKDKG